jgi:hypothetical protein
MAAAKKEEKKAIMGCACSGHITKFKQSIFAFRYLWLLLMKAKNDVTQGQAWLDKNDVTWWVS